MVDFSLYLITDREQTEGRGLVETVEAALKGGVGAVQLREKDLSARELMSLGRELRVLTRRYGARLLINDRVDIALALDCDGVHLGQRSITPRDARQLLGGKMLVGVSTHTFAEAALAEEEGADFITFGPVYPTPSKARYGEPVGVGRLRSVRERCALPLFALGGVKKEQVAEVAGAGADGVAVISAILASEHPEEAAATLLGALSQHRERRREGNR